MRDPDLGGAWMVAEVESSGGPKRRGIIQRRYSGQPPGTAEAMRRVRKAAGVTQRDVARRLDCSQQYISNVERGSVYLTAGFVIAYAKAVGVPVQRIYDARKNT